MSESKGWVNSAAAIIGALAALITACVAAAAFLLTKDDNPGKAPTAERTFSPGEHTPRPDQPLNEDVRFRGTLLLATIESLDLDEKRPLRSPNGGADIYVYSWSEKKLTSPNNVAEWPKGTAATHTGCADLLYHQGSKRDFSYEEGMQFCVRTDGGRSALLTALNRREGGEWEFEIIVWEQRT